MVNGVSTLGQQLTLIDRTKTIQTRMTQFQEQIATGVKHQTFREYGAEASRIQQYRADLSSIETYIFNINIAQNHIEQMDTGINETIAQAENVLTALSLQLSEGSEFDINNIKSAASTAMQIVEANMNSRIGNRYLFAGTDVSKPPYDGSATANVQARLATWLDGTDTTTQFVSNINGLTDSELGYSTSVQSAQKIYARADDRFEVDYTVLANDTGFKEITAGLKTLSQISFPTTADVATKDDFYEVIDELYRTIQTGIEGLRASSTKIATASQSLETVRDNHILDRQNFLTTLENVEAADTTDAIVRFQALQIQLDASYRVTAILSELSLARIL